MQVSRSSLSNSVLSYWHTRLSVRSVFSPTGESPSFETCPQLTPSTLQRSNTPFPKSEYSHYSPAKTPIQSYNHHTIISKTIPSFLPSFPSSHPHLGIDNPYQVYPLALLKCCEMVGNAVVIIVTSNAARKTAIHSAAMMTASLPLLRPMILPLLFSSSCFAFFSSSAALLVVSGLESRAVESDSAVVVGRVCASGSRVGDEVMFGDRFDLLGLDLGRCDAMR